MREDARCARSHNRLAACLTLALGLALKAHYRVADAAALRWILGPTTRVVAWITGARFVAEPHQGFLSAELNLLIAPACAGVNFLVVALWSGHLGLLPQVPTVAGRARFFVAWMGTAYVATVLINAARIVLSVRLAAAVSPGGWITPGAAHRMEGVVVYVAALSVLYLATQALLSRRGSHAGAV